MTNNDPRAGAPPALPDGVALGWEVRSERNLAHALFIDMLARHGLRHVRDVTLPIASHSATTLASLAESALLAVRDDFGEAAVFALEDGVVHASVTAAAGSATIAAATARDADRLVERVSRMFDAGARPQNAVAVRFWTAGRVVPRSVRREITAPVWEEVTANYERQTAAQLRALVGSRVPSGGRLILWHGAPGTGKTTALRALSRAWCDWCATHYVTDPEEFLGSGTGYLLEVLTAEPARRCSDTPDWKMIVLEDAGELLSVDAHERMGQALSRLLNITDGLLGQGTNVVILVTTNEPLRALHPAVTRPGRCWRSIAFESLSVAEANAWLAAHDSTMRVTQATTLAELYEVLRGRKPEIRRPFGFGTWAS